ncbi:DoxX family protein, partial [Nocardia abscessus]|uniref:DoxX family protein n=1 Tax=Nocardia abscessus TaxID=120957 RepID=UPI002458640C
TAALAAILTPGHPRTKECAYAGLVFVYGGAATSHLAAGDGPDKWAMPLFFAAATFAARAWLPQATSTTATLRALGGSRRRPRYA